jgi:hypothetical protein
VSSLILLTRHRWKQSCFQYVTTLPARIGQLAERSVGGPTEDLTLTLIWRIELSQDGSLLYKKASSFHSHTGRIKHYQLRANVLNGASSQVICRRDVCAIAPNVATLYSLNPVDFTNHVPLGRYSECSERGFLVRGLLTAQTVADIQSTRRTPSPFRR